MALVWKNLIAAGNLFTVRFWLMLVWVAVLAGSIFRSRHWNGLGEALTAFLLILLGGSLLLGPNILRNDFRQDLPATDTLKALPLAGWQVALGEIMAPVLILSGVQWLLLILTFICCPGQWNQHPLPLMTRLACFFAAAVLLPAIGFISLLIRNAAVLIFPAWFQLGRDGPRGFENTGQQLVLMLGQTLALLVCLLPPALVFAGFWFASLYILGPAVGFLAAGLGALVVMAGEAALAVRFLGRVFERFDLSRELMTTD